MSHSTNTNNQLIAQAVNSNAQNASTQASIQENGVLIIYGNDAEFGDFGQFVKCQKKRIKSIEMKKKDAKNIRKGVNGTIRLSELMEMNDKLTEVK